jgi:hypothetical protein
MFVITRLTWQQADDRLVVVFRCLPGPDGTETEHGRDDLALVADGSDCDPLDANEWQEGQ